ncbi:hypothetical protein DFJ73DRAFT_846311 [Zopfochytrium polystomum]|nr:hypothetical protein DFJ73DRAFT_846311 [Zopfochytrium polystomum]
MRVRRQLYWMTRAITAKLFCMGTVAFVTIAFIRCVAEIVIRKMDGQPHAPSLFACSFILYWFIRPYVSAICIDAKFAIVNPLLDDIVFGALAPIASSLVWIDTKLPWWNSFLAFIPLMPLYIPGIYVTVHIPSDPFRINAPRILRNWVALIVLLSSSALLVAYALELSNARYRESLQSSSWFTFDWAISMLYLGIVFPVAKNAILWVTRLTPAWARVSDTSNVEDETGKLLKLLKRTQYVIVYEAFFGLAGKIIVVRMSTISDFLFSLAIDLLVMIVPRVYSVYCIARTLRKARAKVNPAGISGVRFLSDVSLKECSFVDNNSSLPSSSFSQLDEDTADLSDSEDMSDSPPALSAWSLSARATTKSVAILPPLTGAPMTLVRPLSLKFIASQQEGHARSASAPVGGSTHSMTGRSHSATTSVSLPPIDQNCSTTRSADQFHTGPSIGLRELQNVIDRANPASVLSPEETHAWQLMMSVMADWAARLTSFTLAFLFITTASWSRCNGPLSPIDLTIRFVVTLAAALLVEVALVWLETWAIDLEIRAMARTMEKIQFGVVTFLVSGLAMGSVACIFLMVEVGVLNGDPSECFVQGRT